MFGRLFRLSRVEARRRAAELLERFELADAADRTAKTYSGGMRRRLDLASSLLTRPRVLFLDEPTTGLDPRSRNEIWEIVRDLRSEGTTILLTTQYLEEADRLADEIAVIDHGQVIAEGTGSQLKDRVGGQILEVELTDVGQRVEAEAALLRVGCGAPEEDGRRIVRLDEHRDWGWHLVNHQKYRQIRSPFDKRTYQREYMRERRAKLKADAGHRKTLVRHRLDKLGRLGHTEADSGSVVPSAPSASLNGSGTGGSVGPADRLRASHAELEWRIAETWRVHLATREKFWTRQNGAAPTGNGAPTLTKEVRAAITAALREHDHGRMGAADRELWKKESPVRAAGMGLFLSPWHTGADPRNATRYLEPWRPWKRQRGKPDPVPTFAQLYFEERAK